MAVAQPSGASGVYFDAAAAGADGLLQGEYGGHVSGAFRRQRVGLQVVAQGKGQLLAVEYLGGLPGDGWVPSSDTQHPTRREYTGSVQGNMALLHGGGRLLIVVGDTVWVRDTRRGTLLGMLSKVHRRSATLGAAPPPGAIILFDGRSTDRLKNARVTPDGLLMVGAETVDAYRDFLLHAEFRLPLMPEARGQARANSGLYLQRRYEVQILDSFGLRGEFNECGALYRQKAPDVNMCLPPLAWQTYDITFRAARFDAQGNKVQPARITVRHNGVVVHDDYALTGKTGAGRPEGPEPLPILLQDHGNPVHFRNVWLVPLEP